MDLYYVPFVICAICDTCSCKPGKSMKRSYLKSIDIAFFISCPIIRIFHKPDKHQSRPVRIIGGLLYDGKTNKTPGRESTEATDCFTRGAGENFDYIRKFKQLPEKDKNELSD